VIRFTVTSSHTKLSDIERDWEVIKSIATLIINTCNEHMMNTMAGDDQLEEGENGLPGVGDEGKDQAGLLVSPNKTRRMPLGGKVTNVIAVNVQPEIIVRPPALMAAN